MNNQKPRGAVMRNLKPTIFRLPVKLGNEVCLILPPPLKLGKLRLPNLASPCQIRQLQLCLIWPPV